ncbi:MAG: SDR family oxidoreductase [Candidatus Geothermincolia bacterium]
MDEIRFDGKVAIVTGAGSGLGKTYAMLLASRGAKVVINDLGGSVDGTGSGSAAAELVVNEIKEAGGEAAPNFNSVAEADGAQNIIKTAMDNFGRVDILINNAGILRDKSLLKMEESDWDIIQKVHLYGCYYCTKAAFPVMREQNYGRIISTASAAGLYGNFGQTNYGAAKLGIAGLMNVVKQEGAKYNVLANTIVPIAGTRLTATVMPPAVLDKLKPDFVAPIVAWLSSDLCTVSGEMFTAGAGYYSRAAIMEGPGVFFNPDDPITMEMVAEKIDQIRDLTGAATFDNAMAQTGKALSHLKLD